jgi:lysophospholipase L1-like esterase
MNQCTSTKDVSNFTQRVTVPLTVGGKRLRIRVSNLYGNSALVIGAAHVISGVNERPITFNGRVDVHVPAGTNATSDAVQLETRPHTELAVTLYYPQRIPDTVTLHKIYHPEEIRPVIVLRDSSWSTVSLTNLIATTAFNCFLVGVDVETTETHGTIVAFGDSITAGGNRHWPALLSKRLSDRGLNYGVLNAGIVANRLMRGSVGGDSLLVRFNKELADYPSAKHIIIFEGINDIGLAATAADPEFLPPSASAIIDSLCQLIAAAKYQGRRVYVATLTPFAGQRAPGYFTPEKNRTRDDVNSWIRHTKDIDGLLDFDRVVADPMNPTFLDPKYDLDGQHINYAGQQAISESIDLGMFQQSPTY